MCEPKVMTHLCLGRAGPASLELATRTLVDDGMWAGVAHVAVPLDQCGVGLDEHEVVGASAGLGHCDGCLSGMGRLEYEGIEDLYASLYVKF